MPVRTAVPFQLTPLQERTRQARLKRAWRMRQREREQAARDRDLPRCEVCRLLEPHVCVAWRNERS